MLGYDRNGTKRLVVEAKFWAALQPAQPRGYIEQLDAPGPGVLLFIAPESRIETLWAEIRRRMESDDSTEPKDVERIRRLDELTGTPDQTRIARIVDSDECLIDKRLMLISWTGLLDAMSGAVVDGKVASDIGQLRGLAAQEDKEAFKPIHAEEFGLTLPRRIRGLNRLIDDVIKIGRARGWITTKGLKATPLKEGYGRYFRFVEAPGILRLSVHYHLWATSGDTPLWLMIGDKVPLDPEGLHDRLLPAVELFGWSTTHTPPGYSAGIPIHLKARVEYELVLDDALRQIGEIRELVDRAGKSPEESTAEATSG
ncbi:MAG: hypothetical protein OXE75_18080 [bacterium]|nr:hypothetical protein [bacterium]